MLNNDKLYPHNTQNPKLKDFVWLGVILLAAIQGFQILQWFTVDVLGLN